MKGRNNMDNYELKLTLEDVQIVGSGLMELPAKMSFGVINKINSQTLKQLHPEPILENCTFIGDEAGSELTEGDGITIIGDGIRNLDKSQKGVLFLGDKIAIGSTIGGVKINLKEVIKDHYDKLEKSKTK